MLKAENRARRVRGRKGLAAAILSTALAAGAALAGNVPAGAVSGPPAFAVHSGPHGESDVNVCSYAVPAADAHCNARVRTDSAARSARPARAHDAASAATVGNNGAYDPSYLQSAYNVASLAASAGGSQTVAIVDAYDDPSAASDMASYRSFFGLPACGAGCFTKVDENGGTAYPTGNTSWSQEISLDLDMVSAICPNCHILLVEAASAGMGDLGTAVNTAVRLGATAVSNSYGGGEFNGESTYDGYYNHPGVAVTVSSGDNGYGVEYPAASRYVTAVGGTSLQQATNTGTRNATETAWSGAGSGCSSYETKPAWQTDTGCSRRTVADVSAVADPNTGVWVYDTYGASGWYIFGGTSVASPIVASVYALAGNPASSDTFSSYPYATASALNDVTSGSNGRCTVAYLCTAVSGFDGPTGLGTPNGVAAFSPASSGTGGTGGGTSGGGSTTAPSAPTGLTGTVSASNGTIQVALSWTASTGATGYSVSRTPGTVGPACASTTSTSCTDSGLAAGTTYTYTVTASNSAGTSAPSSSYSVTTPTAPGAPSLSAGRDHRRGVDLKWTVPATGGSAITSYVILRSTLSGSETTLTTVGGSTTSYKDTATVSRTTYYYEVRAVNGVGTGPVSNQASAVAR